MSDQRIEFGRVILRLRLPCFLTARPPVEVIEALERTGEEPEPVERLRPSIETILGVVAETHGVTIDALKSARRGRTLARQRQEAMWLAARITIRSLRVIGRVIGGRDHTTIAHGIERIERIRAEDGALAARLDDMGRRAVAVAERKAAGR